MHGCYLMVQPLISMIKLLTLIEKQLKIAKTVACVKSSKSLANVLAFASV